MRPLFCPPRIFVAFICYMYIDTPCLQFFVSFFLFPRGGTWLWIYLKQVSPKEFYVSTSPTKRDLYNIMHVPIVIWERNVLSGGLIWSEPIVSIGKASTILSVTFADQNLNLICLKWFPLLLCTHFEISVSDCVGLYCSKSQGWSSSLSGHVLLYKTQVLFCGRLWNTSWSFSLMKIFIVLEAERIVSY